MILSDIITIRNCHKVISGYPGITISCNTEIMEKMVSNNISVVFRFRYLISYTDDDDD